MFYFEQVFFSAMIDVAGHSKDIKKAFSMLDSMKKDGLKPGPVVYSSLMGVCSNVISETTLHWTIHHSVVLKGAMILLRTYVSRSCSLI